MPDVRKICTEVFKKLELGNGIWNWVHTHKPQYFSMFYSFRRNMKYNNKTLYLTSHH